MQVQHTGPFSSICQRCKLSSGSGDSSSGMATFIDISEDPSDRSSDDDDIQIIELNTATQNILAQGPPKQEATKSFNQLQCPICFDDVSQAMVTPCGHIFCLECIQKSISSSAARGQTGGRLGTGLCPLCRKLIHFKDTTLLRMKVSTKSMTPPPLATSEREEELAKERSIEV